MEENQKFEMSLQKQEQNTTLAKAMTGQRMQEIQAMVFMAKQFPRDEIAAMERIKTACSRKALAELAMYAYPRGGQTVTGPSIRLAEVIMQNWGNLKAGVIELDNTTGESKAMSYAWDIETNSYDEKIFSVKHIRDTKQGAKTLTDNRDIYEKVANEGARRKRACILAVVPAWVVEEAVELCKKTQKSNNVEPLIDRVRRLFGTFKAKYGITKEMIEANRGYPVENFTEDDGIELQAIYNAIKDGSVKKEDAFEFASPTDTAEEEFRKLKEEQGQIGIDGGAK
jgi:hypothetical protein